MRCFQTWGLRTGALWGPKTHGKHRAVEGQQSENMEPGQSQIGAHGSCYLHHEGLFFFCSSGLAKTKQKK